MLKKLLRLEKSRGRGGEAGGKLVAGGDNVFGADVVHGTLLDLLVAARQNAGGRKKIYAVGINAGGLVALHAAAVDDSIAGVATYRTLASYQDVMENLHYGEPASSLVWGALTAYDLPELGKAIQPRPYIALAKSNLPAVQSAQEILKGLQLL